MRKKWLNLNGEWSFAFDDERNGEEDSWYKSHNGPLPLNITVPFAFQSKLSGIGDKGFHDVVWYQKQFEIPDTWKGQRVLMHFGAVDYIAKVWIDGQLAVVHEGGHTPFQADITDLLHGSGVHTVTVRAEDFSRDVTLPRGKQYWLEDSASIFYTRTTGIWQTVWLEPVNQVHIDRVQLTPDIDRNEIGVRVHFEGVKDTGNGPLELQVNISFQGQMIAEDTYAVTYLEESRAIKLQDFAEHGLGRLWSPEKPNLYDISLKLSQNGHVLDAVSSYFGMRKISIENGRLCLNNRPYFQRLVLDQGYFSEGGTDRSN